MNDPVYSLIRNTLELQDDFVFADTMKLQEIPNLDSLSQVRLMTELDQSIEGGLSMDEILGIESLADIRALLETRGKERAGS